MSGAIRDCDEERSAHWASLGAISWFRDACLNAVFAQSYWAAALTEWKLPNAIAKLVQWVDVQGLVLERHTRIPSCNTDQGVYCAHEQNSVKLSARSE